MTATLLKRLAGALAGAIFIAAPAAAEQVYALSGDGVMRMLADPNCAPADCRWVDIDRNRRSVAMAATVENVFQLHDNGEIWVWTGRPCDGGSCPHWRRIDRNPKATAIAANYANLFQLHDDGSIWRWKGAACDGDSCPSWERIGTPSETRAIAAQAGDLYALRASGAIYRWTGAPCGASVCPGWSQLDRNPATRAIAAGGYGNLYQLHEGGAMWRWKGSPCTASGCPSWDRIDRNPATRAIEAAPGALYQLHDNGAIWRWKGGACDGASCASWEMLDRNPAARAIAAASVPTTSDLRPASAGRPPLFQVRQNGSVWRWKGEPCAGANCPPWDDVTGTGAFAAYSPSRGGLYVFDGAARSVSVASSDLGPEAFGYDTMRFARTAPKQVTLNVLVIMSTYADTSFDADQTADYYRERFFGAADRIEAYYNKNSRDVAFKVDLAGIERVRDPRELKCAHRWETCDSRDGASFEMASAEHIEMLPAGSAARYRRYDRNNDGRLTPDELFVMKIEGSPPVSPGYPYGDDGGIKRTLPRCATLPAAPVTLTDPSSAVDRLRGPLQICGDFLPTGDETNFVTVVHEITHLFGAADLYGSGRSYRYTLMGATWEANEFYTHLDPWHKMVMGLVKPKIVKIPASTTARQSLRLTLPVNDAAYEPVLFYRDGQPAEYFMLEFRRNKASSFDYDVPSSGLVVWHVKTDASFRPLNYTSVGLPEGAMVSIVGAPGQTVGAGRAWTSADGVVALNWPGGGDSGLRLQVKPFASTAMFLDVEWWRN
ncbi:MAG: hypothetical protein VX640_04140 [Pseudomonadota bacterium]|nr:hypothetical protein [Pseudomonadota bacterium]